MSLAKMPTFKMHEEDGHYDHVELKIVERWKEVAA